MIYNQDAEQSVLGALLLDNDAYDRLGDLRAEHFYRADHQQIFSMAAKSIESGGPVDVVTLSDKLPESISLAYLHELATNTPSSANIGRYAEMVRACAQRRALAILAGEVTEQAKINVDPAGIIDKAQAALESIAEQRIKSEPIKAGDDMVRYIEELERRAEGTGPKAIPTGFSDLDAKMMGGFRRGELWIVAARPKMGKSAFAFNVALNAAEAHSVLVLSMEMPKDQIHDRNIAVLGEIDLPHVIDPRRMQGNDWAKLTHAAQRLETLSLYLDDQGALRLMDVRMKARQVKRRHGLDLIVIDYLQLMDGEGDNRNAQIEGITRGLKALAKELKIAIVLLSQLNRSLEQRPNKRPMPSDLRDSGAIEQDCDGAIFLYRDEVYNPDSPDRGICEANIGLIRQGEPGTVGLKYVGKQTKFQSLALGTVFGQARPPERKTRGGLKD
ncbi:replicative DNA helicase [Pusillimonas noertemannii]|uniref:Replicative DNA helicase n=1 Tax=Pusillimonas noertemannii TaxID=305977 RepID=A0A2U1CRV4_9BURK|nr:replicative DNA helicase [Pusillimonas noertemannii]NYT67955.1 replicative DNA helicase [Pusillimonas noertemannii]PVY68628.1 replicative DNA helicase [Pusillimonas noertemannii]TFL11904.1 replicative DNA helicase [Pusillimonas noertemannii]